MNNTPTSAPTPFKIERNQREQWNCDQIEALVVYNKCTVYYIRKNVRISLYESKVMAIVLSE